MSVGSGVRSSLLMQVSEENRLRLMLCSLELQKHLFLRTYLAVMSFAAATLQLSQNGQADCQVISWLSSGCMIVS